MSVQERVAEKLNVGYDKANEAYKAVVEAIKEELKEGNKVIIKGFGTFTIKDVPARSGTTKLGGVEKAWSTPAHKTAKFSVSDKFKNELN